jgi:hypothetical protein
MIKLILNVIDDSMLISEIVHNDDGSFTESPLRLVRDINEASKWIKSRGGHLGKIVSDHPIHHRCRQAEIEFISPDDALTTQELWGDTDSAVQTYARFISAEALQRVEYIPFRGRKG